MHNYFLLNIKHGASQLHFGPPRRGRRGGVGTPGEGPLSGARGGLQLSSAGTGDFVSGLASGAQKVVPGLCPYILVVDEVSQTVCAHPTSTLWLYAITVLHSLQLPETFKCRPITIKRDEPVKERQGDKLRRKMHIKKR